MSILIRGMKMPTDCTECQFRANARHEYLSDCNTCPFDGKTVPYTKRHKDCPLVPLPPHGDLIDRDALIKEGWLNLHKEVMRMGGYAIHELPLINPSIPVIIPAEEGEG